MLINEVGCIKHRNVEFVEETQGISYWRCFECLEVFSQFEDSGSGC
jgi:hypothetical protein